MKLKYILLTLFLLTELHFVDGQVNATIFHNTYPNSAQGRIILAPNSDPPYQYQWTGPNGFTSTSQNIFGLYSGLYSITVTDSHGCIAKATLLVETLHCMNGVQDEDEQEVDCGGTDCVPCPHCYNSIQDGDETGIDCGGLECDPCGISGGGGSPCLYNSSASWDPIEGATAIGIEEDIEFGLRTAINGNTVAITARECETNYPQHYLYIYDIIDCEVTLSKVFASYDQYFTGVNLNSKYLAMTGGGVIRLYSKVNGMWEISKMLYDPLGTSGTYFGWHLAMDETDLITRNKHDVYFFHITADDVVYTQVFEDLIPIGYGAPIRFAINEGKATLVYHEPYNGLGQWIQYFFVKGENGWYISNTRVSSGQGPSGQFICADHHISQEQNWVKVFDSEGNEIQSFENKTIMACDDIFMFLNDGTKNILYQFYESNGIFQPVLNRPSPLQGQPWADGHNNKYVFGYPGVGAKVYVLNIQNFFNTGLWPCGISQTFEEGEISYFLCSRMNVWNSTYEANSISVHEAGQYISILPNTSINLGANATFELSTTCENGYNNDFSNTEIITQRTTSLEEPKGPELFEEVYPNPIEAGNLLYLNASEKINSIELYTMFGQLIRSEKVNSANYIIKIDNIPSGAYFLTIKYNSFESNKKLIIQ